MDNQARSELISVLNELRGVARDLENAADDLDGMLGVGTEVCAGKLRSLSVKYSVARQELSKLL